MSFLGPQPSGFGEHSKLNNVYVPGIKKPPVWELNLIQKLVNPSTVAVTSVQKIISQQANRWGVDSLSMQEKVVSSRTSTDQNS